MIARPSPNEANAYTNGYIEKVEGDDLIGAMDRIHESSWRTLGDLEVSPDHSYAPGKWTIKEVIQHLIDTERILSFRALAFSRGEKQEIPGFEEDEYAANSHANEREFHDIMREYDVVRSATKELYSGLSESVHTNMGVANGGPISVRALGWMIAGHELHHVRVIKERYL